MMQSSVLLAVIVLNILVIFNSTARADARHHAKTTETLNFCAEQILARPIQNGYTWTLGSRLAQALTEAEKRYGKRDMSWTLAGVEFTNEAQPKVWYPFSYDGGRFILVQLTQGTVCDEKRALFQLAHEVIHLLSPAGPGEATTVFEEGLATYFSIQYAQEQGVDISPNYISSEKYSKAYDAIAALYASDNNDLIDRQIRQLRKKKASLAMLTKTDIKAHFPQIDDALAGYLAEEF